MGRPTLVTIGRDATTDWVKTPDGLRYNLGPISVLRFVAHLVPKATAKAVLNSFLSEGEVLASVDEDKMWALLAPHRARWSTDASPSMSPQESRAAVLPERPETLRKGTMTTFSDDLAAIERHIQALDEAAAKKATNLASGVSHLVKLADKIKSPNQSKNTTYYGLGSPSVFEVGDSAPKPYEVKLAFDVFAANEELANKVLASTEKTLEKIDALASAGKKFAANRARNDVRAVATKVAGILRTDLTASWVQDDLTKLAARAEELHGLFANAKV